LDTAIRPTRADRDQAVDCLREGVSAGLLTVDEFEERLNAAYLVMSVQELHDLVMGLPRPARRKEAGTARRKWALLGGSALVVCILIVVAAVVTAHAPGARTTPTAPASPFPTSPVPASTPAAPGDLAISLAPAGPFRHHDPANECGAFGTARTPGGDNCYVVVEVTNISSSAVNVVPADLSLVDQNGNTYAIAPVAPACYDTVDVNAPATLAPKARLAVQLCYPVQTGALPQHLVGSHTLNGLTVAIPSGSVNGTWGGA
jgi:hypothetical protein